MIDVIIGLGSSMGDRQRNLALALQALDATAGLEIAAVSRIWCSPPMGQATQPFLNAAARVRTTCSPHALLQRCKAIEQRLGRRPARRWSDRVIDLDILLYGGLIWRAPALRIPHPELTRRGFALLPAQEVAAHLPHPELGLLLSAIPAPPGPVWPAGALAGPRLPAPGQGRRA